MPTCCAPGCTRTHSSNPECTFFTLPWTNKERIRLWLAKLKLVHPPAKTARICHYHFEEKFLLLDPKYKIAPHLYPKPSYRLSADAYPSLFSHTVVPKERTLSVARQRKRARLEVSGYNALYGCIDCFAESNDNMFLSFLLQMFLWVSIHH